MKLVVQLIQYVGGIRLPVIRNAFTQQIVPYNADKCSRNTMSGAITCSNENLVLVFLNPIKISADNVFGLKQYK
ncbi:hypothetical protein D3C86_1321230 [compost metagenome]